MKVRAACFFSAIVVVGGVIAFFVSQHGEQAGTYPGGYSAIVWLPHGDSQAQAQSVRAECGAVPGAASLSGLSRSTARQTKSDLAFSITMRWGPDDKRSNSLLNCLNDNPGIDHYSIPL